MAIFYFGGGGGGGGGGKGDWAEFFDSFGRGSYEEHLGEIILNFGPTIQEKMPFKDFFYFNLSAILSGSFWTILVAGFMRNIG